MVVTILALGLRKLRAALKLRVDAWKNIAALEYPPVAITDPATNVDPPPPAVPIGILTRFIPIIAFGVVSRVRHPVYPQPSMGLAILGCCVAAFQSNGTVRF